MVMKILKSGCEKAEIKAQQTLEEVRKSMKINYFDKKYGCRQSVRIHF